MTSGPRLLFVTNRVLGAITVHIRGRIFQESFGKAGWSVRYLDVADASSDEILKAAGESDVVYMLKVTSLSLIRKLRTRTRARLVYDLTDALWKLNFRVYGWFLLEHILLTVDALFGENSFVDGYGRKYNPNLFSIPACTQVERFDQLRNDGVARTPGKVRLGWMGTKFTATALKKIADPLRRLCARHPEVEIRTLGARASDVASTLGGLPCSALEKYDETTMIKEILGFDVGLFPPPKGIDDYCIRGALKGMLYMTGGRPAVSQRAGDPARIVQDGVTGMLASTPEEWEQKLEQLVSSEPLRRDMGAKALDYIRREHSLAHVFEETRKALEAVLALPDTSGAPERAVRWTRTLKYWTEGYRYSQEVARVAAQTAAGPGSSS